MPYKKRRVYSSGNVSTCTAHVHTAHTNTESRSSTCVYLLHLWHIGQLLVTSENSVRPRKTLGLLHIFTEAPSIFQSSCHCSFGAKLFPNAKEKSIQKGSGTCKSFGFIYDECAYKHHLASTFSVTLCCSFLFYEKIIKFTVGKAASGKCVNVLKGLATGGGVESPRTEGEGVCECARVVFK